MVLLIGCGCGSSDDNDEGITTLNTPAEVEKNIIGSWSVGCKDRVDGLYETDKITLNADGTGEHEGAVYTVAGCDAEDKGDSWRDTFTYVIASATISIDGKDAVEIDIILTKDQEYYYTMLHFTAIDKFIMADTDDVEDGETPETRENDFAGQEGWVYIKQ